MSEKSTKILSLQGLRALAFAGIFTSHTGLTNLGPWGVSCFLVLSGFLMYYNHGLGGAQDSSSVKDNIVFAIRRVKALYPLHCVTFIITLIVHLDEQKLDSVRHIVIWVLKALANILLLQSCFPKSEFYFSFNTVSWYLSTSVILYFAFPYIRRLINRIKIKHEIMIQFVIVIAIQSTVSVLLLIFSNQINRVPMIISDDLTKYVTYICPLYRMGDFYIGCLLGYVFLHNGFDIKINKKIVNGIEVLSLTVIGLLHLIYNKQVGFFGTDAFRYTLLYTLDAMLLVYIIGLRKGFLSKYVLSSRIMVLIGDLSGYAFLIHPLIIAVIRSIIKQTIIMTLFSFIATMAFAYMVMMARTKAVNRFLNRK